MSMPLSELDENCKKILVTLVLEGELRFNKLAEIFRDQMSKPTLSLHLGHLTEKRFIIRTVKDVQLVTYQINPRKFNNQNYVQTQKVLSRFFNAEVKNFVGLSLDEQMGNVCWAIMMKALEELKARINYANRKSWENEMLVYLWTSEHIPWLEKTLIALCDGNEEFTLKVFKKIEEFENKITPDYEKVWRASRVAKLEGELHG